MQSTSDVFLSEEVITLSKPPNRGAKRRNSYTANGFLFRVKSVDNYRSTQNSGVALQADTMSVSSKKDKNPRVDALSYYGRLTEIIIVTYSTDIKYVLFKCDWVDPSSGTKLDLFNFTLVNFKRVLYRNNRVGDEPFILASQAHQVWYVPDPLGQDWQTVVQMPSRDLSHVQVNNNKAADMSRDPMAMHAMEE